MNSLVLPFGAVYGQLAEAYEDCTVQQFPVFQNKTVVVPSPDWIGYQLDVFDVITGLNNLPLGQLPTQITPETLLYNLQPCDTLSVSFLKASQSYTQCHELCTALGDSLYWVFNLPSLFNQTSGVVEITSAAQLQQVLAYFILSISQVDRAYFASLALSGSVTPLGTYGATLLAQIIAGTGNVYTDPFNLLSIANSPTIVPAVSFNLNYLNTVQIGSQTFFQNYLP